MTTVGDYIKVYDSTTNELLMSGRISNLTDEPAGYSVDNMIFVNFNSLKFKIEKVNTAENYISKEITKEKYNIIEHNDLDNSIDYDFFMWNEIEPEVKEICELLNQIPGIETYSSCSGHGIKPPWVEFFIRDNNSFGDLLEFLRSNGQTSKTYKHQEIDTKHRFIIGVEGKGTCHLESTEINGSFKDLCRVLKKYIMRN